MHAWPLLTINRTTPAMSNTAPDSDSISLGKIAVEIIHPPRVPQRPWKATSYRNLTFNIPIVVIVPDLPQGGAACIGEPATPTAQMSMLECETFPRDNGALYEVRLRVPK